MKKILIIEDEQNLLEEVIDWLQMEGYEAYSATNGKLGVEMAILHKPDLMICDIMMPEMDGKQVLKYIRENDELRLTPFIFTTALGNRIDQRKGIESGADDYIVKPFSRKELLEAIRIRLEMKSFFNRKTDDAVNEIRMTIIKTLPHELRTPLNGILGFAQHLKEYSNSIKPDDVKDAGEIIYTSALRLLRLVQNYNLYTEIELGFIKENRFETTDNAEMICDFICNEIASNYKRSNDLDLQIEGGPVHIPEFIIHKITEEIVDNAFKFSENGSKVIVNCKVVGNNLMFTVKDEGRGITAEGIRTIAAFVQFDRRIYEQQGSGLGLVIIKKLVDLYNGTFEIRSEPAKGTEVIIVIPG